MHCDNLSTLIYTDLSMLSHIIVVLEFLFPSSIVTGQMDGVLNLIGHNGLLHHCVPAHDKPISVLRWYGNKIITGGYDNAVKVHRTSASLNRLVCVNSVFVHEGNILALAVVEVNPAAKLKQIPLCCPCYIVSAETWVCVGV